MSSTNHTVSQSGTTAPGMARADAAAPSESSGATKVVQAFIRHWLALILIPLLIFVTLPFLAPVAMNSGWAGVGNLLYKAYTPFCHQLPQRSWFLFGEKLTYTLDEINQAYPYSDAWRLRLFTGTAEMGWKVAWSDRMVSFYFMVPIFGLLYALVRQVRGAVRPIPVWLLILLLVPLIVDGATHMVSDLIYGVSGGGFRDTNVWLAMLTGYAYLTFYAGDHLGTFNWWMRLITGVLAAWALAFWAFPWIDRLMSAELAKYESHLESQPILSSAQANRAAEESDD